MDKIKKDEMIKTIEENIEKLEKKDFNLFFFVLDTKGNPSGSLEYVYQTAYTLKELGYNVTMLHNEKEEFIGVDEWLGSKYSELTHKNVTKENVDISASDFLFIPEIFAGNVMTQTKNLPCKRIVILQNYNYLSEFMPITSTFENLKIYDAITTTKVQEEKIKEYFPNLQTYVVSPSIKPIFRNNDAPRKLIINVIAKNQEDVYRVMKPFYWKYPAYKWVSFRELRGFDQETLSDALRESPITVWVDEKTNFGYTAIEAIKCGSILLGKVPETLSDWNVEKDENGKDVLTNACIWFDHIDDVPDMLANIVRSWTLDKIPDEVYDNMHKFDDKYTQEIQKKEIEFVYNEIISKRLNDFKEVLAQIKSKKD